MNVADWRSLQIILHQSFIMSTVVLKDHIALMQPLLKEVKAVQTMYVKGHRLEEAMVINECVQAMEKYNEVVQRQVDLVEKLK